MKTLKDFKNLLFNGEENTALGLHLNNLFNENDFKYNASVHNLEEKIEVIAQMYRNGIDCFKDGYKLGSVTKAYYQYKASLYEDFK